MKRGSLSYSLNYLVGLFVAISFVAPILNKICLLFLLCSILMLPIGWMRGRFMAKLRRISLGIVSYNLTLRFEETAPLVIEGLIVTLVSLVIMGAIYALIMTSKNLRPSFK